MGTAQHAAQSFYVMYQQLPVAVQTEFRQLLEDEDDANARLRLANETLRDDWDAPENDFWDALYAKQHPNG